MKKMRKNLSILIAALLLLTLLPTPALAAGGDFAIFGGSGGAGGTPQTLEIVQGGPSSQLSSIGGAGGNSTNRSGGGGGEAGLVDGGVSSGGTPGSNNSVQHGGAGGGTNTGGVGGDGGISSQNGGNGTNGGGGGGGSSLESKRTGGTGSTKSESIAQPNYDAVSIEGGGGGGGGHSVDDSYSGDGGDGGSVVATRTGNLDVSGAVDILGGSGGAGGNYFKDTASGGVGGDGGMGGDAGLNVSGNVTVGGTFFMTGGANGINGVDKLWPSSPNTGVGTPGTGGAGGNATFTANTLTAPIINLTKQDGAFSFTAGVLTVDADTTINLTDTAFADVNITTVNVASGKTLTINNANGELTIDTLNISGTGNVVVQSDSNLALTTLNADMGVTLSAPTGTAADKSTANLVLAFSRTVTALPNGTITINDGTSNYTYTIPASPAIISGTGTSCVATIPFSGFSPSLTLAEGKTYTVSVSADAFQFSLSSKTSNNVIISNVGSFTVAGASNPGPGPAPGPTYYYRTLTDLPTGVTVSGQMTSSAALTVQSQGLHAQGTCSACDEIRERQAAGELIILYDISVSGGYSGSLEVSIPVDAKDNGQTVTILHCRNGVLESINVTVSNGMAKGTFTSLSPFAVVQARGGAISGLPDAYTLLVGQSVSWTPSPVDGAWSYDSDYLTMSESGGIYTFTAQKIGRTVATYTADGVSHSVNITINGATIPQTGDVSNPLPFLLLALASLCGMGALALYRKKSRA